MRSMSAFLSGPAARRQRRPEQRSPRRHAPGAGAAVAAALLAALLVAPLASGAAAAAAAASAPPARAGIILPLVAHPGPAPPRPAGAAPEPARERRRRRALLADGAAAERGELSGNIHLGYFTARLHVGTPPQAFDLIADTGSTLTYIPCAGCARCGAHTSPPFDPAASRSARNLTCGEPACAASAAATSCEGGRCYYSLAYAESSRSEGWLIREVVALSPRPDPSPMTAVIGCINQETGMIYSQKADGLIGLGNAARALPWQLAESGQLSRVFGLCFGFPSGGALLLGDAPLPAGVAPPAWTPLLQKGGTFYTVELLGIDMEEEAAGGGAEAASGPSAAGSGAAAAAAGGTSPPGTAGGAAGRRLAEFAPLGLEAPLFARGYGTVLDSGTTFTYLPTRAFDALSQAIVRRTAARGLEFELQRSAGGDVDLCWQLPTGGLDPAAAWGAAAAAFPLLRLRFGGGATLVLPPHRYLFAVLGGQKFCLGLFDNGDDGTLIGGISVRDALVVYDLERARIGFSEADCDQLGAASDEGGATIAGATAAPGGGGEAAGAAAAAAGAAARGREGELVAEGRPQAPVTAAYRQGASASASSAAAAAVAGSAPPQQQPEMAAARAGAVLESGPAAGAAAAAGAGGGSHDEAAPGPPGIRTQLLSGNASAPDGGGGDADGGDGGGEEPGALFGAVVVVVVLVGVGGASAIAWLKSNAFGSSGAQGRRRASRPDAAGGGFVLVPGGEGDADERDCELAALAASISMGPGDPDAGAGAGAGASQPPARYPGRR
ncbi:eukaryotic aspartyl protease [Raphidocelis subcapitata]|uniref:Eukaryotic aspartyl protease n=1 Tax=Raphidocelis subcapitata TaxID=307507 RepID=A0A2V0NZW9_9CHLO|nr:eukaryotic aspartyl protease [Raphidocelis subcapitata]|eukprot:GBF92869.1 eukaryotic aspartyl protease [Raphidocelis subcapitata]